MMLYSLDEVLDMGEVERARRIIKKVLEEAESVKRKEAERPDKG
jgi:FimV-like protein